MENNSTKNKNTLLVKYLNHSGDKTIRVIHQTLKKHPTYKKYVKKSKKYLVHFDSDEKLIQGDKILIKFTRPLSKNKSYKFLEKISKDNSWYRLKQN